MQRLAVSSLIGLLIFTAAALSHHSFAAHYFEDQSVTVQGELVEFEYISPHAWVHVMVKDSTGEAQKYSAEWNNPNRLASGPHHVNELCAKAFWNSICPRAQNSE